MNELTFLDLVILKKIDDESSVEKFGSIINTSFFETANLLGTVKIKGYINIESSVGGISKVTLTDAGKSLLAVAQKKASDPSDPLDDAILQALAGGTKELGTMQGSLNIRSADLAYHLEKLVSQGFIDYTVKSAKVSFMLTEKGFNETGGIKVQEKPKEPEKQGEKEDVSQILSDAHDEQEQEEVPEEQRLGRELTPEEKKRLLKEKRFASKMEHYVKKYGVAVLVILCILAIITFVSLLSALNII